MFRCWSSRFCNQWALIAKRRLATPPSECDVVIVGGGLMGSSTAYHLMLHDPSLRVCIVEKDPSYAMASSALSLSGIRQQFSNEENILLSLYSLNFLRNIGNLLKLPGEDPPNAQFVEQGYLVLASEEGAPIMEDNYKVQRRCGVCVELLSANQLQEKFPWINTEGVTLASFGYKNEGWFDPWTLLTYLKKKAVHLGAHFLRGETTGIVCQNNRVNSIEVTSDSNPLTLNCKWLLNAAGPWAEQISSMAGIGDPAHPDPRMHWGLPVKPRRRMVFSFHCSSSTAQGLRQSPLVINTTGVFFRPEPGDMFLAGKSPVKDQDPDGLDFRVDYSFFDEVVWPDIAHRAPVFESIKVRNAWAGLYEYNTLDQNAILGPHPVISNLLFINGFSGHGAQQSVAAGRVISDIIFRGNSDIMDFTKMSFQRVIDQKPFKERNIF